MRKSRCILLLLPLSFLFHAERVSAQTNATALQPGTPIERTLAAGQTHSYNISLEQDQLLQLVVDQRGIDVVVRVFSPAGRRLGEFDTPNGADGPENVTVIAEAPGLYRIDVAPLGQNENLRPGRYEIKVVELRKATEEELQAGKNQEALTAKGVALLVQTSPTLQELRRPQTRAGFQIRAARLLWNFDEKRASKLTEQAIDSVKEFIASIDPDQDYYESFQIAMQLRREVIEVLTTHDPEMALSFLRATRTLSTPDEMQIRGLGNQELELELALVGQIAASDPKRAFQLAQDTLKRGYPSSLVDTLHRLRSKEPELATKLAHEIAAKLANAKLLKQPEAAYLALSLLRTIRPVRRTPNVTSDEPAKSPLVSDEEYRELVQHLVAEALAYPSAVINMYSPERNAAQNILQTLKEMGADLEGYAPGSAAAVEKKLVELNSMGDPRNAEWQRYQTAVNNGTIDSALEAVNQAPREVREQLYQQIANKAAAAGDLARARQIITDNVTNPMLRQQSLKNVSQQAIMGAAARGKTEEALRLLSNFRPLRERTALLSQIVNLIGQGQKKANALIYLEQARSILGPSPKAEDQDQMRALLEIGRAFSRYDAKRAFEIVEPLIDQFNEISEAAIALNGFGQRYYQDGELIMNNGNSVAETGNYLAAALASLATANFERAKTAADRIHPTDARLHTYLTIAQETIEIVRKVDIQVRTSHSHPTRSMLETSLR
jgi:hypothetical protein